VKERLTTVLLAAGALVLFYVLLFPKPRPAVLEEISKPLSTDAGADGELALWQWLHSEHIPVTSLRYRYDHLLPASGASIGAGNVLLTVMPHRETVRAQEWQPLGKWLAGGNTIIVLAALDDTPRWTIGLDTGVFEGELKALTNIVFTARHEKPGAQRTAPDSKESPASDLGSRLRQILANSELTLEPVGEHPLLAGVHRIHGVSEFPAARWRVASNPHLALELLKRTDDADPALWLERVGQGQIVLMSLASPFSNGQIDRDDNARLLSNIIGWSRAPGGTVIFDDVHQGLAAYYDAHAFYSDPRLHRTLWWLLLLWLAFVLGPLPLRSAWHSWQPVDETALVEASSRFYSVAVPALEAAHRLFENFFNRLRGKLNLPQNGMPLWEWLDSQSRVSADERAQLQTLYAQLHAGERPKLAKLQTLLSDIQRKVA
jgi:hypothetical protein